MPSPKLITDNPELLHYLAGKLHITVLGGIKFTGDSLTYSYASGTTNQLQSIADATTNDQGLKHGSFNYTYDGNGNIIADGSKGLTVTYNLLNLPATNTLASSTVSYVYDASGRKLRRLSTSGGGSTTDYVDGIQYNGTAIDFIQTEEGRVLNPTSTRNYEYALGDHLGNARVTFDTGTGTASVVQRDDYMPFGMEVSVGSIVIPKNEYLYNKKELQEELGQYDYGARFYDPVIGRWTSVDPLADHPLQIDQSPYGYVANNPILRTDPDGRFWQFIVAAVEAVIEGVTATEVVAGGTMAAGVMTTSYMLHHSSGGEIVAPRDNTSPDHLNGGLRLHPEKIKAPPAKRGNAPIGEDGHPVELHHRDQTPDGPVDEMTRQEHREGDNYQKNHTNTGQNKSKIDRSKFKNQQKKHWKAEWDSGRFKNNNQQQNQNQQQENQNQQQENQNQQQRNNSPPTQQ